MATNLEPDSKSDTTSLPSYDAFSTPPLSLGVSIQHKQPSVRTVFKFSRMLPSTRTTVLSRIRDLLTTPDYTPSTVTPIVNSCANNLSAAEFSSLLQSRNIEGHAAMYWAIVNDRREALSAFTGFISKISSVCSDELRLACMTTSDHALFMQLNLGRDIGPKYEPLRCFLGCPPDDIEVREGDELGKHNFVASLRFRMFQKRLRIMQNVDAEFVAGGRIWWLQIYMGYNGKWVMAYGLSEHSLPAFPRSVLFLVESQRETVRAQEVKQDFDTTTWLLVPSEAVTKYAAAEDEKLSGTGLQIILGNWLMEE